MAHIVSESRETNILGALGVLLREASHAVADAQHRLIALFRNDDARLDDEIARLGLTQGRIVSYVAQNRQH